MPKRVNVYVMLVAQLDKPADRLAGVRVIRLQHASAKQIAEVMRKKLSE
jgi:hypothetical protein